MSWLIGGWALMSGATVVVMRGVGPWWKLALGALAAPVLPIVAAGYRIYKDIKRRRAREQAEEHRAGQ